MADLECFRYAATVTKATRISPPPPRYCNLSLVPFRGLKDLRSLGQELAVVMACEDCSADPGAPTFGGMALAMDIFYHSHHFCPSARLGLGQIVLLCYR